MLRYFRFCRMKQPFHFGKMKNLAKCWARSVSASRGFWRGFLHWEYSIKEKKWPIHKKSEGRRKQCRETPRKLSMSALWGSKSFHLYRLSDELLRTIMPQWLISYLQQWSLPFSSFYCVHDHFVSSMDLSDSRKTEASGCCEIIWDSWFPWMLRQHRLSPRSVEYLPLRRTPSLLQSVWVHVCESQPSQLSQMAYRKDHGQLLEVF